MPKASTWAPICVNTRKASNSPPGTAIVPQPSQVLSPPTVTSMRISSKIGISIGIILTGIVMSRLKSIPHESPYSNGSSINESSIGIGTGILTPNTSTSRVVPSVVQPDSVISSYRQVLSSFSPNGAGPYETLLADGNRKLNGAVPRSRISLVCIVAVEPSVKSQNRLEPDPPRSTTASDSE
ncbi:hypothetical protein BMS3Bbin04_00700 [bacterium BMS3Bbin04]|nr:hypothetical protein BMS3Bbin04_00700 [bacterium BMS3Bbin04]